MGDTSPISGREMTNLSMASNFGQAVQNSGTMFTLENSKVVPDLVPPPTALGADEHERVNS